MLSCFIVGMVFGSFCNVVGLRLPKHQSIIWPASTCPSCHTPLNYQDLIPVISYIRLQGKCRFCEKKITFLYPLIEVLTGVSFMFCYSQYGLTIDFYIGCLLSILFAIITVSDLIYMIIPNQVLLFFLIIFIGISPQDWQMSVLGATLAFTILYIVQSISKDGLGSGDIKLFFVIGYVVGSMQVLVIIMLAALIGLLTGSLIKYSKKGQQTVFPFGPSIALATMIVYWFDVDWSLVMARVIW
ncbi:type 4 prepilin-like proteins leader peptide-processing enzyme [Lysinibacillus alkalisoli]|uniref:Type 4 prepilin-like proteins leader peptide-processing enzyme n=1 Tax=Lysinibacillus alkalisoli TaxID=1911548 RepID=A0A917G4Y9_9BACI|nr:A24 family peptidase [Lysinibacillus alkalisoli]GGG22512.1 type 4 prepilin-like proteins leader peptide-processing enzyme [Lysinibacillus alkalisoli]